MGWKAEHKEYMVKQYSRYCVLARELKKEIKPYCLFELEDLEIVKKHAGMAKRQTRQA